jgi:protease-4
MMKRDGVIGLVVLCVAVLSVVGGGVLIRSRGMKLASSGPETMARFGVGVVDLRGAVRGSASSEAVAARLSELRGDPQVRAVVVRIASAGGPWEECSRIAEELAAVREQGLPVVAAVEQLAVDGAFLIAAECSSIVADRGSVIGLLGWPLEEEAAAAEEAAGGDEGAVSAEAAEDAEDVPTQEAVPEELAGRLARIAARRGAAPEAVWEIAGRRALTAKAALEAGLIDVVGDFQEAVARAGALAGLEGTPEVFVAGRPDPGVRARSRLGRVLAPLRAWFQCEREEQR